MRIERVRGLTLRRPAVILPLLAVIACSTPGTAPAQVTSPDRVIAPQLDSAALRARLAPSMARPDRPMPKDSGDLDAMVARKDWTSLSVRLRGAQAAADVMLDMNWEQTTLFNGGGFLIAYSYLNDLWRVGSALPGEAGEEMKQSAGMIFLYALDLIRLDGAKCADVSAPGHRQDQLIAQNSALIAYVRALPRPRRMTLGTISLAVEAATAVVRKDDDVLCSGGLDEIGAGLRAQGNRPLNQVPTPPGGMGRTYSVPRAPDYTPRFVGADRWRPKQVAIRASLPGYLTGLLTKPAEAPAASTP